MVTRMKASRRGRFTLLGLGALGLMLLAFLWLSGYLPLTCLSYDLTGYYCPGCGSGRMVHALVEGQFFAAFAYNPVFFFLLPLAGIYACLRALEWAWYGRMVHGGGRLEITFWVVMMALAGIFGILRNLPQFWMLAPGGLL